MKFEWDEEKAATNLVSYTEREDSIRLISAREATKAERKAYEQGGYGTER